MSMLLNPKSSKSTTAVEANCACPAAMPAAKGKFAE
jgi:hypothetical protein